MSVTETTLIILHHQMKTSPLNLRIVFSVSGMRNYFIWVSKNSPWNVAGEEVTRMYHSAAHGHVFKFKSKLERDVFLHSCIADFCILVWLFLLSTKNTSSTNKYFLKQSWRLCLKDVVGSASNLENTKMLMICIWYCIFKWETIICPLDCLQDSNYTEYLKT